MAKGLKAWMRAGLAALPGFVLSASLAEAQSRCAVSLVLAMDVSSSVNDDEFLLQMEGLARAITDPEIMAAIRDAGGMQIMAFEWSGRDQQVPIAPWSYLTGEQSILAFAARVRGHKRRFSDFPTAMGFAMGYASIQLQRAPLKCARQVVDVSGDGVNNEGYDPYLAYENFLFDGVQVNGLVIAGAKPDPVGYYRDEVIFGPGAFVEVAVGFADFEHAMKRKLLREINGAALSLLE